MKILFTLILVLGLSLPAKAQFAAQNDAKYIATLKAVVNYKINDEENMAAIESLRENKRFNQQLQRMLNKLQNTRTKNSTNSRIYKILINAGKDIYQELD